MIDKQRMDDAEAMYFGEMVGVGKIMGYSRIAGKLEFGHGKHDGDELTGFVINGANFAGTDSSDESFDLTLHVYPGDFLQSHIMANERKSKEDLDHYEGILYLAPVEFDRLITRLVAIDGDDAIGFKFDCRFASPRGDAYYECSRKIITFAVVKHWSEK